MIKQGDLFWIDLGEPIGSSPGYKRPYVVIQNNAINQSRINTVVVCALSANLKRATAPGTPPLSDYALSRESFYEDHPKL